MDFGTIRICELFVGIILGEFGDGVLEEFQGFSDRVGHVYVDVVLWVVPIDGQSVVLAAIRVYGHGLMLSECIDEVGGAVGGE